MDNVKGSSIIQARNPLGSSSALVESHKVESSRCVLSRDKCRVSYVASVRMEIYYDALALSSRRTKAIGVQLE